MNAIDTVIRRSRMTAVLSAAMLLGLSFGMAHAQAPDVLPAAQTPLPKLSDQEVEAKYAAWKATLSPEALAWEAVIAANIGDFYLPVYKRDKALGLESAWDYVKDDPSLPRVLLIGDSISRGYTIPTRHALAGKVNLHRAPENCGPSINGLAKLDVYLGAGKWDVIHFNFGIHDWNLEPADYANHIRVMVERLQETGARLVWASSTPLPAKYNDFPDAESRLVRLNALAAGIMKERGIPINDLHAFVKPQQSELQNPKDCHYGEAGYTALADQVAGVVLAALKTPPPKWPGQAPRAAEALLWQDTFDRAELGAGWHVNRGGATNVEGRLHITGPAEVVFDPASIGLSFGRDLRMEYDAMSATPGDLSALLGVVNSRDDRRGINTTRTGYLIAFGSRNNTANTIQAFEKEIARSEQPLIQTGKWHHVVIEKRGNALTLTVDGTKAVTAQVPRLWGGGGVGFYAWNNGQFDNLKVYALPPGM